MPKALICGIGGQDGSYLAQMLLARGYEVWGTSRDAQTASLANLKTLGITGQLRLLSMAPNDFRSVLLAVERSDPDEIYYLAGQSSVGLSFEQPAETLESIVSAVLNLLEVIRLRGGRIRLYNAGSSECFGDTGSAAATETTPFFPRSPYGVAKASAHWLIANYREAYGLFCCTGILFNHESPLRPARFVTRKIVSAAARIATGQTARLEDFVAAAFAHFGLDWRAHVKTSSEFARPNDFRSSRADPSQAAAGLDWRANVLMPEVVRRMCEAEN